MSDQRKEQPQGRVARVGEVWGTKDRQGECFAVVVGVTSHWDIENANTFGPTVISEKEGDTFLAESLEEYFAGKQWRPIDTAPGPEKDVLVYVAPTKECFVAYRYDDNPSLFVYAKSHAFGTVTCRPTHWQPLLQPPTEKGNDDE